jgi:AMP-polyphosphate phosphotransferase
MFKSAELGHRIEDAVYKKKELALRADLLDAQYDLIGQKPFAAIILVNGVDGAGKGETINLLNEWMDTRHIANQAFGDPSEEEDERPYMWRFWRVLPPKGKIGILFGNWYTYPIVRRVQGKTTVAELDADIQRIVRFERMLCDEGVLLLKFWFHLSKKAQKKRLTSLEKDPRTRWRVTKQDWRGFERYNKFAKVSEHVLRRTSTGDAPWVVVEGQNANYRNLTVGTVILESLRKRMSDKAAAPRPVHVPPLLPAIDNVQLLRSLDLTKTVGKDRYKKELEAGQRDLACLCRTSKFKDKHSVVLVLEGSDAGGKGGTIRRITPALDARQYQVIQIAAPTEEERVQPYLWRFWRHLPRRGRITIFDRSWYGRVLVERVEGFARPESWMRAYSEINDFEEQLAENGTIVVKLWLAISKEEQLRRFKEREKTRFKRFKITEEDWRNRKKWDDYEVAATDMIDRTSTDVAPWTLVEANDKHVARLKALDTVVKRIEKVL